jgi:hypothetical protein
VNTPKNKKNAPAAESGIKRLKRSTDKLIRLDDLISEHQVLFALTDATTKENNQN